MRKHRCYIHGVHEEWSLSNKYNDGLELYCDKRDGDKLCSRPVWEPPYEQLLVYVKNTRHELSCISRQMDFIEKLLRSWQEHENSNDE